MAHTGPALRLLFDTGHCAFGGGDAAEVLSRHVTRVPQFHARNLHPAVMADGAAESLSFLEAIRRGVFSVPGDAESGVDFPACLALLAAESCDGWLVIEAEQDPDMCNAFENQSLGLHSLRSMASKAGLTLAA